MPVDIHKLAKPSSVVPSETTQSGFLDKALSVLNKDIRFSSGFSDKKKEAFYTQLGILLESGIDIKTALELLTEEQTSERDKAMLTQITSQVVKGTPLSQAMREAETFSVYEIFSTEIGEESGKLAYTLTQLSGYYQKKIKQRRQIISALTYPAIVSCTSFGAVFFMLRFVVPMFEDVFKRFGGNLPLITQWVVDLSNVLGDYFMYFFVGSVLMAGWIYKERKKEWLRKLSARVLLRIPFIGNLVARIYLTRLSFAFTLLLGSRINLTRAIALVRQMIPFYPLEVSLRQMEDDIVNGSFMHTSMAKFPIYPKRMISLIKVGEEVNQLPEFFEKIAKQYSDEVEHQSSLLSSVLEPLIIVFLGVLVGFILIAMYLPLFKMSTAF
ncbi:type II secretion system F family protein [Cytophagaceae bacterium YF14B1]|uniref:General secretion pathway protein F n=1 Tax=Xanthocytophaga flava TaxID=3048013 RepID=A0AAE3UBU2_9BACT|nr:type II secretion system F family protein [Xanthocytophaga flavus]MDJ1486107.1 type II secretion system F family protein [Xanthocytophaga flavus]